MAAISENYSGGTFLSDLVTRPEFLQYTSEGIFEQSKWVQSGIIQRNAALDARAGGTRVRVPFHDPINPTEEQILSNATWGTGGAGYLTPQGTSADEQIMTILHRGFSYAADDLSKLGSGALILAHVRNQLTAAINKLKTSTLKAQLLGLFGGISAAGVLGPNQYDATVSGATPAEANYISVGNVLEAKNLLGERGEEIDTIAMHSAVAYYLQQIGMLTFSTSALAAAGAVTWGGGGVGIGDPQVATFAGLRVVIDDQLTWLVVLQPTRSSTPSTCSSQALFPRASNRICASPLTGTSCPCRTFWLWITTTVSTSPAPSGPPLATTPPTPQPPATWLQPPAGTWCLARPRWCPSCVCLSTLRSTAPLIPDTFEKNDRSWSPERGLFSCLSSQAQPVLLPAIEHFFTSDGHFVRPQAVLVYQCVIELQLSRNLRNSRTIGPQLHNLLADVGPLPRLVGCRFFQPASLSRRLLYAAGI